MRVRPNERILYMTKLKLVFINYYLGLGLVKTLSGTSAAARTG